MKKLALDIAIVPPEEIMTKCIKLSEELLQHNKSIQLNMSNKVPHITLAMGVVNEDSIEAIINKLKPLVPLNFNFSTTGLYKRQIPQGQVIGVKVSVNNKLMEIHKKCMDIMKPYLLDDYDINVLADSDKADPVTLKWIKGFSLNSAYKAFSPHITLSILNTINWSPLLPAFNSSKLSIFQLGEYCTCQKEIHTFN